MYKLITKMMLPAMLYTSAFAQDKPKSELELLVEIRQAERAKADAAKIEYRAADQKREKLEKEYEATKSTAARQAHASAMKDYMTAMHNYTTYGLSCALADNNIALREEVKVDKEMARVEQMIKEAEAELEKTKQEKAKGK